MRVIKNLRLIDWHRAALIAVNVPFLILLHVAFIAHLIGTTPLMVCLGATRKDLAQAFGKNYSELVLKLFR